MKSLVVGGAGYIGSHCAIELLNANHDIAIIDNLSNSSNSVIENIEKISKRSLDFFEGDILDNAFLSDVFNANEFDAIFHFAGKKSVNESIQMPLNYYSNNLIGSLNIIKHAIKNEVPNFIFSSSATVYSPEASMPVNENSSTEIIQTPYGRSKKQIEEILKDIVTSGIKLNVAILRYFNPAGAHPSGLIGESPKGKPNNLVPIVSKAATGEIDEIFIYGDDYKTKDGTGIRDYIHVVDLAKGHISALEKITSSSGINTWNLGTGYGISVMELISAFEKEIGHSLKKIITKRREGDRAICYADVKKSEKELNWAAEKEIADIVKDSLRWELNRSKSL